MGGAEKRWGKGVGCKRKGCDSQASHNSLQLGAGIAQLVVLGLAAKVSRVRYSSGDIFR